MQVKDIKVSWGKCEKTALKDIGGETARLFIRELKNTPRNITTDVYVCSDARNQAVRQILAQLPNVNMLNTAGNVVYNAQSRPSVLLAHGNTQYEGCGAVDYSRTRDKSADPEYPAIAQLRPHPIENAEAQLDKVAPDWRAGVIYFNHETGEVSLSGADYKRKNECMALFEELKAGIENTYTPEELKSMAAGQNPDIIFLNNLFTRFQATNTFRINLQGDSFDGIVDDSLKYAMDHALRGEGSFKDSRTTVLAFRDDAPVPEQIVELLETRQYVRDYISRGGEVYIISVGNLPSSKEIYRISA